MFNILNITKDRDQPVFVKKVHHRPAPQGVDEKDEKPIEVKENAKVTFVPAPEVPPDLSLLHESFYGDGKPYGYSFWCPGCKQEHVLPTRVGSKGWTFNGNLEKPTFTPSVKIDYGAGLICHLFVTGGNLAYCPDTTHSFSSQTVPMTPF